MDRPVLPIVPSEAVPARRRRQEHSLAKENVVASYLYRLGSFAYRRRGWVVAFWALVLGLVITGAVTLAQPTSNSFTLPGTEAQKAIDLLDKRMPTVGAENAGALVVFTSKGGDKVTDPPRKAAIDSVVKNLAGNPQVVAVTGPFEAKAVSPDGHTAYAQVKYGVGLVDIKDATREALFTTGRAAESAGLTVEFGGEAVQSIPKDSASEVIGLIVAALVLMVTFGSLLAAGMPLLTAILGVSLGMSGIQIATRFTDLSSTTSTLALMLGLAVAVDYSLFIVSRYRHELQVGRPGEHAAGRAVGTAGSAVVFAGLTVVIALVGLSVLNIPFVTKMGLAAAGTVAMTVVIALTLLPAILGFAGQRILSGRIPGLKVVDPEADGAKMPHGERWARFITRRRGLVALVVVLVLGVLAVPAFSLRLGLPDDSTSPRHSTQRLAYDQVAKAFGPGANGPLLVTVDAAGAKDPKAAVRQAQSTLSTVPGVQVATPPMFNQTGDTAIFTVIPTTGPGDAATVTLTHALRDKAKSVKESTGVEALVTGHTAMQIDVSQRLSDALVPYLLLVVGLAFVLLTVVFRSLLVPLKAALGFLLSVIAAFGAEVAVFQWGWLKSLVGVDTTGPIVSFLPIILVGVMFGLAMDYEVFLVTRMREEHVHGASAQESIHIGLRHGARVVTAAAIIMVSVFGGFITSDDTMVKSMGFALAFGIFIDAFVVRMTVVPLVLSLLGEKAWWLPRWLDRVVPNVDIEGEKLVKDLDPAHEPELTPTP